MADTSIREWLILSVVDKLKDVANIKEVSRRRPTLEQLQSMAQTQLPLIAVTAGLPVPNPHWNERNPTRKTDKFKSDLVVDAVLYDMLYEDDQYDSRISELANDLWIALHSDQTWGGYAAQTTVAPDADVAVWDPYLAFRMRLTITYIHGIGGI